MTDSDGYVTTSDEVTLTVIAAKPVSTGSFSTTVTGGGKATRLKFVPQTSGTYAIMSSGQYDTVSRLFDGDGNELMDTGDGGDGGNFSLWHWLSANETYFFDVSMTGTTGTATVGLTLKKASTSGTNYRALLVGEDSFIDSAKPSYQPRHSKGASNIAEALRAVHGARGGEYLIRQETDLSPAGVRDAIADAFEGADEDDVSLFYISTHGVSGNTTGKWAGALSTGANTSTGTDSSNTVFLSELAVWLRAVPGSVVVIIDVCGSGAAMYSEGGVQGMLTMQDESVWCTMFNQSVIAAFAEQDEPVMVMPKTGDFRVGNKFYVLTSASYQEESYAVDDGSGMASVLSGSIKSALGTSGPMPADQRTYSGHDGSKCPGGDEDGYVILDELFRFVKARSDTRKFNDEYVHPQCYPTGSDYQLFTR